ncbi:YceH family protein [Methylocaldum sp. MU1018]
MKIKLTPHEARVIGCLIEKEIATPEQYPLSLNALTNACNQKSNRDPVLDLDEATVQQTLDGLVKKYLVSADSGFGNRVTKYRHRFCNAEFGDLKLSRQETAIVCELLLRGPQTPGELRSRAERLCKFADVQEIESALARLMAREEPLAAKLPREPGKRESRFMHLFFDAGQATARDGDVEAGLELPASDRERLHRLERAVDELMSEVHRLQLKLAALSPES